MTDSFFSPLWYRLADLRPALKPQVEVTLHDYGGEAWHVLRDPVTGKLYRFTAQAWQIVGRMRGQQPLARIWEAALAELGPQAPSQEETVQLLSQLYQADLLSVDATPDAAELLDRMQRQRRQKRQRFYKNPLAIPLPLFDPDRFLDHLAPLVQGRRAGLFWALLWLAVVIPALGLLPLHWEALTRTGPREWLALDNLVLMACVYPVVKALHELAHGLAAKRHGGAVHETGIMFLVFYPVPYVDASSSAFFPQRRARALVGGAGILAELWLAAGAFLIWLAAEPGLLRDMMFNVMLIGGISTVLVNGNPLLKFDGYYVLCDLLGMPNLGPRANKAWGRLAKAPLGLEDPRNAPRTRAEAWVFYLYAPAAFVYRIFIMLTIAVMVSTQYFIAGVLIAVWSMVQALVVPLFKTLGHLWSDPRLAERRGRAWASMLAGLAGAALLLLSVPLPLRETAQGVVWLPERAHLRVETGGVLVDLPIAPGTRVAAGAVLAVLDAPAETTRLQMARARQQEADIHARATQVNDRAEWRQAMAALPRHDADVAHAAQRVARLELRAAVAGRFYMDLPDMAIGRYFPEGAVIAHVLPDRAQRVRTSLPEPKAEFLDTRLRRVTLRLPGDAGLALQATDLRRVPMASQRLPAAALGRAAGGRIATDPGDPEGMRALDPLVTLDLSVPGLEQARFGQRVEVKFDLGLEPVGFRLWRRARVAFLSLFTRGAA